MDADWERLCEDLQKEGMNYEGNIEDLFRAELYLISPITDPVRFLKKEYFLTSQQRDIEKKILRDIYAKQSGCFWFSGIPGTGKTLLLYDIAMKLSVRHRICSSAKKSILCKRSCNILHFSPFFPNSKIGKRV